MSAAILPADDGACVDVSIAQVDAADEQAWNDAILDAGPVVLPSLRLWRYRTPAVVLGRSQQALARQAALAQPAGPLAQPAGQKAGQEAGPGSGAGLPLVERRAGGGAVLVGPWMLSMSLAVPVDHSWVAGRSTGVSYDALGRAWTEALHLLGVDAHPADEAEAQRARAGLEWACFAGITRHEVLVGPRKIVGLAQRRHRHGVLYVAGLLVEPVPWPQLVETMRPWLDRGRVAGSGAATDEEPARGLAQGLAEETVSIAEARGAALPFDAVIDACLARIRAGLDAAQPR